MTRFMKENKKIVIKSFLEYTIPDLVKFGDYGKVDLMDFYEISTVYAEYILKNEKMKLSKPIYISPLLYEKEYRIKIKKIIDDESISNKEFYLLWMKYLQLLDEHFDI